MEQENTRSDLDILRGVMRQFADERDWGRFHTPKNLAIALSVEASELLEPFQWLATGEKAELGDDKLAEVRDEMADVLAYLLHLANRLDVDLYQALLDKMERNRLKYPVDQVRGDARKYSDYQK